MKKRRVRVLVALLTVLAGGALWAQQRMPDIHFVPTRQTIAEAMLKLAGVSDADMVYDLGSGDGRIVITAAQRFGARGVGIELDPKLVGISQQVAREGGVADLVTFIEGDLFKSDISAATVVTLYLSNTVNMRLEPKLRRELPPGHTHRLPALSHWCVAARADGQRGRGNPNALDGAGPIRALAPR